MKKVFFILLFLIFAVSFSLALAFNFPWTAEKNVILIIPDGCSIAMWASIRAMTVGTDGALNIDKLPVQGRCRTYSANAMITDSAAAGTAYACGVKTGNGIIGMNAATVFGDSLSGKSVESILEIAEKAGLSTGIVTTSMIQHATPAAFYSHRADRNWYELIAGDLLMKGIDVIMGGGRYYMIPMGVVDDEGMPSRRSDSRDIITELRKEGYTYVFDKSGFDGIDPAETYKLLGIFNPGHMEYEYDRLHDKLGEPPLWEMTDKALQILSRNKKGFFLIIEAARIDHAAHGHDTVRFLWDGIACDKTIGVAAAFAKKNKGTLLIVAPDHGCGGPHFVGAYEVNGVDSTLVSYDDAGFIHYRLNEDGFPIGDGGKPIAIQWVNWGGHTGEDVGVHSMGEHSERLCRLVQNTDIFTVMAEHLGLKKEK